MQLTIHLLNKTYILDTVIDDTMTILEFMNKYDIYTSIPETFKALIYNGKKIDNKELISTYTNSGKLYFWFQLRWFLY
jgi:hypothetical protein